MRVIRSQWVTLRMLRKHVSKATWNCRGQDLCLTWGKVPGPRGDLCTSEHHFSFCSLAFFRTEPPSPSPPHRMSILLLRFSGILRLIKSTLKLTLAPLPAQPDTLTSSLTRSLKHKHTCKHGNRLDHYGLRLGLPQARVVCGDGRTHTSMC